MSTVALFRDKLKLLHLHFQEPGKPGRRRQLGEASDAEHYSSNDSLSEDERFTKNNRPSYTKQHSKPRVSYQSQHSFVSL